MQFNAFATDILTVPHAHLAWAPPAKVTSVNLPEKVLMKLKKKKKMFIKVYQPSALAPDNHRHGLTGSLDHQSGELMPCFYRRSA